MSRCYWLETDLETDDLWALLVLSRLHRIVPRVIVVGEGDSSIKAQRIQVYIEQLYPQDYKTIQLIQGQDSHRKFGLDGLDIQGYQGHYQVVAPADQYASCFKRFVQESIDCHAIPTMILIKPIRELIQLPIDQLGQVEAYMYGGFNLRTLLEEQWIRSDKLVQLLNAFKRLFLYESHFATGSVSSICKQTMPLLYAQYKQMLQLNKNKKTFVQCLDRVMTTWNQHMLSRCIDKQDAKSMQLVHNIQQGGDFQMVAADQALTCLLPIDDPQNSTLVKPVNVSFDPASHYTTLTDCVNSSVYCFHSVSFDFIQACLLHTI